MKLVVEKMSAIISFLFLVVVISIGYADRNTNASLAVCAKYPNEEFAIDLFRCQNTCEKYGRMWDCPGYYKPNGDCYCKKGFARIKKDGECVSVKNNAKCAAILPITPMSCRERGEMYVEDLNMRKLDRGTCLTTKCPIYGSAYVSPKWSPHCECRKANRRLRNGTCVPETHPLCIAEYQPSPERCAAMDQIYKKNAPCQKTWDGPDYCPLKGGDCVCPPGMLAVRIDLVNSIIPTVQTCMDERLR